MNPTPIPRPRRPLSIVSRRRLNGGTEYQVRWNNGRDSVGHLFHASHSQFVKHFFVVSLVTGVRDSRDLFRDPYLIIREVY